MRLHASFCLVLLSACNGTASLTLHTGDQTLELSADTLALPIELQDSSSPPRIAQVPCGPSGMCPTSDTVSITCVAGVCDPEPKTFTIPIGDVIDIDAFAPDLHAVVRRVDEFDIEEVAYDITLNTLTVDVGTIEVHWGPEGAATIDPALGVRLLGTVPPIAAGEMRSGDIAIDAGGAQALSDYLVHSSHRVRIFARTTVDLVPGGPFPTGTIRITVNATIRAVGSLIG